MNKLHDQLTGALRDRSGWEDRARAWWMMTLTGLRRRNKAAWMADTFWPLISESIQKLTPFYYNQAFSQERFCNFSALDPNLVSAAETASQYLDWQIRQDHEIDESGEFEQSLRQHPLIPMGTPDPYRPPAK